MRNCFTLLQASLDHRRYVAEPSVSAIDDGGVATPPAGQPSPNVATGKVTDQRGFDQDYDTLFVHDRYDNPSAAVPAEEDGSTEETAVQGMTMSSRTRTILEEGLAGN